MEAYLSPKNFAFVIEYQFLEKEVPYATKCFDSVY